MKIKQNTSIFFQSINFIFSHFIELLSSQKCVSMRRNNLKAPRNQMNNTMGFFPHFAKKKIGIKQGEIKYFMCELFQNKKIFQFRNGEKCGLFRPLKIYSHMLYKGNDLISLFSTREELWGSSSMRRKCMHRISRERKKKYGNVPVFGDRTSPCFLIRYPCKQLLTSYIDLMSLNCLRIG